MEFGMSPPIHVDLQWTSMLYDTRIVHTLLRTNDLWVNMDSLCVYILTGTLPLWCMETSSSLEEWASLVAHQ